MRERDANKTRRAVLAAAQRVVLEEGVQSLTLGRVGEVAGVSKGGVLHHFPTKRALVAAMVQAFSDELEARVGAAEAGGFGRAYLRGASELAAAGGGGLGAALLAASVLDPQLLTPLRRRYQDWQQRLERDEAEASLATLVRLAGDGLWLAQLFELAPPSEDARRRLVALAQALMAPA